MQGVEVIRGKVLPEWIDINNHMNVAYYVLAFDQGVDLLLGESDEQRLRNDDAGDDDAEPRRCHGNIANDADQRADMQERLGNRAADELANRLGLG